MKFTVELRNHLLELHNFRIRLAISAGIMLLLFLALLARFYYLQVIQSEHYHTLAEANRISIAPLVPNRGLILDRNGKILAQNYSTYTLEVIPNKIVDLDATLNALAEYVEITPNDLEQFRKLLRENKRFKHIPIRNRLTDEEVARFAANRYRFPGIEIQARILRYYPYKELASHVVGYISRISDKDLEQLEESGELDNYRGSHFIGRIGIEQSYEKELHGITGFDEVETDAAGRSIRVLSRTPPVSGNNLVLTLDIDLQRVANDAFGNRRGALVAIDPNNGEVLAFVSKPGFNANLFVGGIDHQNWKRLNNSTDKPLNNRALRGVYPPGSTFKPFMALAALELGLRSPGYAISDIGYFSLPSSKRRYRDWKVGGHGMVDLQKSLVVSCDTYYYGLAHDMGIDRIYNYIKQFGLGKKTGIDIHGEVEGLLPSREWKMRRYNQRWYAGDTISVGIGQGYVLTTPLQLAFSTGIIANRGTAFQPHFVKQITNNQTDTTRDLPKKELYTIDYQEQNIELVHKALINVTQPGGTAAAAAAGAEYTFAGKTGTSQVIGIKQNERYKEELVAEHHRDHAVFIAYAPAEQPTIALAVLVENGGGGGSTAAPVARQVLDYFLLGKLPEVQTAETVATSEHTHQH